MSGPWTRQWSRGTAVRRRGRPALTSVLAAVCRRGGLGPRFLRSWLQPLATGGDRGWRSVLPSLRPCPAAILSSFSLPVCRPGVPSGACHVAPAGARHRRRRRRRLLGAPRLRGRGAAAALLAGGGAQAHGGGLLRPVLPPAGGGGSVFGGGVFWGAGAAGHRGATSTPASTNRRPARACGCRSAGGSPPCFAPALRILCPCRTPPCCWSCMERWGSRRRRRSCTWRPRWSWRQVGGGGHWAAGLRGCRAGAGRPVLGDAFLATPPSCPPC